MALTVSSCETTSSSGSEPESRTTVGLSAAVAAPDVPPTLLLTDHSSGEVIQNANTLWWSWRVASVPTTQGARESADWPPLASFRDPIDLTLSTQVRPRHIFIQVFPDKQNSNGIPLESGRTLRDCWIQDFDTRPECSLTTTQRGLLLPLGDIGVKGSILLTVNCSWLDATVQGEVHFDQGTWLFRVENGP